MRLCTRTLALLSFAVFLSARSALAASASSEILLAWWGDLRSIEYPPTERDPATVERVKDTLTRFRTDNPDALLLDVGGCLGPLCTGESPYTLPPFPFYQSIRVAAVNLSEGDWVSMSPTQVYSQMPAPKTLAVLSTGRPVGEKPPQAIRSAAVADAAGHPFLLAGTTRIQSRPYLPSLPYLLQVGVDPEPLLREALIPLQAKHPGATGILLADWPRKEAVALAQRLPNIHLLVLNQSDDPPEPERIGDSLWVVGRPEAGRLATARIRLGENGSIQSMTMGDLDLVPAPPSPGNLWTWLGLASRPAIPRVLAKAPPKPIVGINLKDPAKIVESMGYTSATVEAIRCSRLPEDLYASVSNSSIYSFRVILNGSVLGSLFRVHVELPQGNGNMIVNAILDESGRIVRAAAKVEPVMGMLYVELTRVLEGWQGLKPTEITITAETYPGIDQPLAILKQALELAARIHRDCR